MKAARLMKYGSPNSFKIVNIDKPQYKEDEVLIKIHASSVTQGDCKIRKMDFPLHLRLLLRLYVGILKPRKLVLGQEFSGEIVEVGQAISKFKVGDKVYGTTGLGFGGYAEYIALKEDASTGTFVVMPENITFEEAAGLPIGGFEALHCIQVANLKEGDKLLVNGAGGSIGTLITQLGKYYGAEVTGVDSVDKFDTLKLSGADFCIDYVNDDYTKKGKTYDVIIDVIGKSDFKASVKSLNAGGSYLFADWRGSHKWYSRLSPNAKKIKYIFGGTSETPENLKYLNKLIVDKKIVAVIDKIMPLEEIIEAHQYVDKGFKKGNLIIKIQ